MNVTRIALIGMMMSVAIWGAPANGQQDTSDFYRGKQIKLLVGAAPGGGAELYARVFAKYYSQHMPGQPTVVINNAPGAGGLLAAGRLQNVEARDGTVIASLQRNNLIQPMLSDKEVGFDPRKVNWLGSLNKELYVIIAWHTAPVKTAKEMFEKEMLIGSTGGGSETLTFPMLVNEKLNAKFKIVRGYPGSDDIALAIQRGEVHGRAITWSTLRGEHPTWLRDKQVNILVQLAVSPSPDLPTVPSIMEFAKDPSTRSLFEFVFAPLDAGRPFAAPLEIPAPRLAALQKGFVDTAKDPGFIEEVKARGGSVELFTADETRRLVEKIYATPADIVTAVQAILNTR